MRITATIIMRNEAVLIASKIAACSTWADEIVVVDQRSEDGSAFIAKETLRLIGIDHKVETMRGDVLGKEFSYAQVYEAATGDWVVYTDVDEILVCPSGLKNVLGEVPEDCIAPGTFRWHGIVNGDAYFKVEEYDHKRFRLLRKPGVEVFDPDTKQYKDLLHKHEPVKRGTENPKFDIPKEKLFLIEMKAPYQHYADQLFYVAVGSRNDRKACEEQFSDKDLLLGKTLYELGHQENAPRKRWWWPF